VLADQIKSIDRHARKIEVVGGAPVKIVQTVLERLNALLSMQVDPIVDSNGGH
jgi:hypothetical protein